MNSRASAIYTECKTFRGSTRSDTESQQLIKFPEINLPIFAESYTTGTIYVCDFHPCSPIFRPPSSPPPFRLILRGVGKTIHFAASLGERQPYQSPSALLFAVAVVVVVVVVGKRKYSYLNTFHTGTVWKNATEIFSNGFPTPRKGGCQGDGKFIL